MLGIAKALLFVFLFCSAAFGAEQITCPEVTGVAKPKITLPRNIERWTSNFTPRDGSELLGHYRRGALRGYREAQFGLAMLLFEGDNDEEAVFWLRRAANQCSPEAKYQLGKLYAEGRAVSRDLGEAKRLVGMAASQGYKPARAALPRLERGEPLEPKEPARTGAGAERYRPVAWVSYYWGDSTPWWYYFTPRYYAPWWNFWSWSWWNWWIAALGFFPWWWWFWWRRPGRNWNEIINNRRYPAAQKIAPPAKPKRRLPPRRLTQQTDEKKARAKYPHELYLLGMEKLKKGDFKEAAELLTQAVEKGHADARYPLGKLYEKGNGVEKDTLKAYNLCTGESPNSDTAAR